VPADNGRLRAGPFAGGMARTHARARPLIFCSRSAASRSSRLIVRCHLIKIVSRTYESGAGALMIMEPERRASAAPNWSGCRWLG